MYICSASQEIHCLSWNLMVYYHVHINLKTGPYYELDEASPLPHVLFLKDVF
jgi:hypothetical protein